MRLPWVLAVLALAIPIAPVVCAVPGPASAATEISASCPNVLLIESTNGKYYVAAFQAHAPTKAEIDLTLYAKNAAYSLSLPVVTIDKPISSENYTYRTGPIVIQNPGDDALLGASVQSHLGAGSNCPGENVIIPSVASLTAPDRHIDPDTDAIESQLALESAKATDVKMPVATARTVDTSCDEPFADASVVHLVKPTLSDDEARDPDLLPTAVRIQLDSVGAVLGVVVESSSGNSAADAAVVAAARKTTYRPARFACQPERSSHVIRVDFTQ